MEFFLPVSFHQGVVGVHVRFMPSLLHLLKHLLCLLAEAFPRERIHQRSVGANVGLAPDRLHLAEDF